MADAEPLEEPGCMQKLRVQIRTMRNGNLDAKGPGLGGDQRCTVECEGHAETRPHYWREGRAMRRRRLPLRGDLDCLWRYVPAAQRDLWGVS